MAAVCTLDEFVDLIRKCGVMEGRRLESYLQQLRASGTMPDDPEALAELMVSQGLMTQFQAEPLLANKPRRFIIAGKYKLIDRLGSGGMASVYLCEHRIMRRRVAIKVLPISMAKNPAALERFHREARASASLDHPNIVRAHDVDADGLMHFLVIEYIEGRSLHDLIRYNGVLEPTRAAHYIAQTADGLQHAHEQGLVHRDIKPANLLLDRSGTIKILDLGLALFFHDGDELTKQHDGAAVLGTADYLAPEQGVDSHAVDIRADIYSLGITFYFLLTGRTPFGEGTVAQKLVWHHMKPPTPPREYRPEIPEAMEAVLLKMIAKEPGDRYQTPAEVSAALEPWHSIPIAPPGDHEMPKPLAPVNIDGATSEDGMSAVALPAPIDSEPRLAAKKPSPDSSRTRPAPSSRSGTAPARDSADTRTLRSEQTPAPAKSPASKAALVPTKGSSVSLTKPTSSTAAARAVVVVEAEVVEDEDAGPKKAKKAKKLREAERARRKAFELNVTLGVCVMAAVVFIASIVIHLMRDESRKELIAANDKVVDNSSNKMGFPGGPQQSQGGNSAGGQPPVGANLTPPPQPPQPGPQGGPPMPPAGSPTPPPVPPVGPPLRDPLPYNPKLAAGSPGGPPGPPAPEKEPDVLLTADFFKPADASTLLTYDEGGWFRNQPNTRYDVIRWSVQYKEDGVVSRTPVQRGNGTNKPLLDGGQPAKWEKIPPPKPVAGRKPPSFDWAYEVKDGQIRLREGTDTKLEFEPVLKVDAKAGDTWSIKRGFSGTTEKVFKLEKFDKHKGRPAAVIRASEPHPSLKDVEIVTTHTYVQNIGEVERRVVLIQKQSGPNADKPKEQLALERRLVEE